MKRILSELDCLNLLHKVSETYWDRVDRYGKYYQTFITDEYIESKLENFFGKDFSTSPILKIIKFEKGDYIPLFSADYSNQKDEYYSRYINTNFIIQTYLNSEFTGGELCKVNNVYKPKVGYGIIQGKTEKCQLKKIENGTCYMLFCFISNLKTSSLL